MAPGQFRSTLFVLKLHVKARTAFLGAMGGWGGSEGGDVGGGDNAAGADGGGGRDIHGQSFLIEEGKSLKLQSNA